MAENDIQEIKRSLSEINEKLERVITWKTETDSALKGMESHGILGYRQKIDLNYNRAKTNEESINKFKLETSNHFSVIHGKIQRIIGTAIGVGTLGGMIAGAIIQIIINVFLNK